jgi:phage baseplate assembly protein W
MANIDVIYSDINLAAGQDPAELVINADSINQNIASIFETPVGSKWFRPTIGSNVNRHLFEPIDDITASKIKYSMEQALGENGESRIVFTDVTVKPDPRNAQYFVNIYYRAPELEAREYNFQFNLSRGFS